MGDMGLLGLNDDVQYTIAVGASAFRRQICNAL